MNWRMLLPSNNLHDSNTTPCGWDYLQPPTHHSSPLLSRSRSTCLFSTSLTSSLVGSTEVNNSTERRAVFSHWSGQMSVDEQQCSQEDADPPWVCINAACHVLPGVKYYPYWLSYLKLKWEKLFQYVALHEFFSVDKFWDKIIVCVWHSQQ